MAAGGSRAAQAAPSKKATDGRIRSERVCAGVSIGLVLALLVWHIWRLRAPFAFDYVEGMMLHGVAVVMSGGSLYPPLGRLPYLITAYTPLYYYLCAAGTALAGYGFVFGRIVSLVSTLSVAAAIALMIVRAADGLERRRACPVALVAASCFYLTLPARNWAILMRVDALEVALAMWGFYAAVFAGRRRTAALLFLAAFLVKHTMFAAPAAVFIAWIAARRWRDALRLAALAGLPAAAVFLAYDWASRGAFFVYLFGIHKDAVLPAKWLNELLFLGRTIPVIVALAAWFLLANFRPGPVERSAGAPAEDRPGAPPPSSALNTPATFAIALYTLTGFLSTLFGMKVASFWNHYLEFCAVACLAAGLAAAQLLIRVEARRDRASSPPPAPAPAPVRNAFIGLLAATIVLAQVFLLSPIPLIFYSGLDRDNLAYVYRLAARTRGEVLSEDVGLLSAARKVVLVSDPYAAHLDPAHFPEDPLLARMEAGEIAMIVLNRDPSSPWFDVEHDRMWSARFFAVLGGHYRKTREYDVRGERFYIFERQGTSRF